MSAFLALLSAVKKSRIAILICWLNCNRIAVFLIWEVFRRSYKELQSLLGCDVDIVTEKGLHWYIRDQVINEARQL
jgi:predicted nucleotidyltransferase